MALVVCQSSEAAFQRIISSGVVYASHTRSIGARTFVSTVSCIAALSSLVAAGCSLPFAGVNSRYYRAKAYCDVGRKRHGRRLPGAATILLCCIPRPAVMPLSCRCHAYVILTIYHPFMIDL